MTIAERLIERGKIEGKQEGQIKEEQDVLLRLLERKFGAVDGAKKARITGMRDRDRLDRAIDRLLDAESVDDVLQALY